jgi:hypothetical protein
MSSVRIPVLLAGVLIAVGSMTATAQTSSTSGTHPSASAPVMGGGTTGQSPTGVTGTTGQGAGAARTGSGSDTNSPSAGANVTGPEGYGVHRPSNAGSTGNQTGR